MLSEKRYLEVLAGGGAVLAKTGKKVSVAEATADGLLHSTQKNFRLRLSYSLRR